MKAILRTTLGLALGVSAALAAPAASAAALTVFESRMPDGSTVVGDRPADGARTVKTLKYDYTPTAKGAAEAERDYWRQQSDAFDRRRAASERIDRSRSMPRPMPAREYGYDDFYPMWGVYGHGGRPLVPENQVPRQYTSSPGAVRGRDGGFIGSGFSTAR